ncbi:MULTISPECIES: hypothetical protein [Rhodomicrobium]|uniref:hypothetical protein n=1 Tax=Rhodomicrobium TaxID=1068 RepID=UPI000F736F14|nr:MULTISPECIES: hypothetical protein [Rhodomicrobium]
MSNEAFAYAKALKVKSSPQKLLLLLLAERISNESGICWPGQTLLADEATMSISQVKLHLKAMEDEGLLVRTLAHNEKGHIVGTKYEIPGFLRWLKAGKESAQSFWEEDRPKSGNPTGGKSKKPKSGNPTDPPSEIRRTPRRKSDPKPSYNHQYNPQEESESSFQSDSGASAKAANPEQPSNEKERHQQPEADGGGCRPSDPAGGIRFDGTFPEVDAGAVPETEGLRPGRKPAPKAQDLPKNSAQKVSAGRRADGTNPKAMGTNPRALGTNPRATGTNPRAKRAAAGKAVAVKTGKVIDVECEVVELTRVMEPTGTEVAVTGRQVAARPEKRAVKWQDAATPEFWAWHKTWPVACRHYGPKHAWEAWQASGAQDHVAAVMAASKLWARSEAKRAAKPDYIAQQPQKWLASEPWIGMAVEGEAQIEDEPVPADFLAFMAAAKGLFADSLPGDVLRVWGIRTAAQRNLAHRSLYYRRLELDALLDEGSTRNMFSDGDTVAAANVKRAQRESGRKALKLDQWLNSMGWLSYQAELDAEIPGFNCKPALVHSFVEEWLKSGQEWVPYVQSAFAREGVTHRLYGRKSLAEMGLKAEWFGQIEPGLPGSSIPLAIVEAEGAKIVQAMHDDDRMYGDFSEELRRFVSFGSTLHWHPEQFGPAPGHPRCLVPGSMWDAATAEVDRRKAAEAQRKQMADQEAAF